MQDGPPKGGPFLLLEATPGFEPGMADLQSAALATWPRRRSSYSAPKNYQLSALKIALGKNQIEGSIGANLAGKVPFENDSPLGLMLEVVQSEIPDIRTLNKKVDKKTSYWCHQWDY